MTDGLQAMRRRFRSAVASAAIVLLFAGPVRADEVDRFIAQEQALYGVPAVVVGVYRDGVLVDQRASGVVNVELDVRADTKHAFETGSISKQFTAWAILILAEEGRLSLDAPVGRYLPDLPAAWGAPTLHRLLTHSSGLPDLEDAFTYDVYRQTPRDAEFLQRLVALPIDFAPGARWAYSNTNYWLLARVIETLSGRSYADFMQERIFRPLGMTATRSALPAQPLPHRASGYQRKGDRLENRDAIRPNTGRGLGDIVTTIADMARWEREQLSPRLVSQASADRARQPVVLNDGKTEPYGYGWETDTFLALPTLFHTGQSAGFTAIYLRVPSRRLAVVVFANLYGAPVESIAERAIDRVDPTVARPPPTAVAESDPARAARVRMLLDAGASADTAWREDWFAPDSWTSIQASLPDRGALYRRLGPLIDLTRVSDDMPVSANMATYRAVYARTSRIVTVTTDDQGRIVQAPAREE